LIGIISSEVLKYELLLCKLFVTGSRAEMKGSTSNLYMANQTEACKVQGLVLASNPAAAQTISK
jgi:hypothetical protein